MKRLWSVFTEDMDTCIFTGSTTVERHHVFGGPYRKKSEEHGFIVPLRPDLHPNGAFFHPTEENRKIDRSLKERCQRYYEEKGGTREEWMQEFGRNYL